MNHSLRVVRSGAWVLAACVLVACSRPEPPQEPVRSVKLMTVGLGALQSQLEYAGEVRIIEFEDGYSTTGVVEKIAKMVKEGKL